MHIGIPVEIKSGENRVSCTPSGVRNLVAAGHRVVVEAGAGAGSGFSDDKYRRAGAVVTSSAEKVWKSDLVVKVKDAFIHLFPVRVEFFCFFFHARSDNSFVKDVVKMDYTFVCCLFNYQQLGYIVLPHYSKGIDHQG